MEIIEVLSKKDIKAFHQLPHAIYAGDKRWVPQPHVLVEAMFNLQENSSLKNGSVCRWIVKDEGEVAGRIAAFVVDAYASSFEQPTGGIGFFECIDNQQVANLLFDTATKWLRELKMEAVDAPINIGENFFNWGVLTKGFGKQPTYGMPYNKKYYQYLYKDFGFQTYYEQFTYQLDIKNPDLPERFWKIAEWVAKKPNFTYEKFSFHRKEKYVQDFMQIYEQAWAKHDNHKRIDAEDLLKVIEDSKFILEEDFIWFVYHSGEPVAAFMAIPDVNQLFRKVPSGKLNAWNVLKLMWYKKRKTITRCRVLMMGVVPKFQRSGLESAIFYRMRNVLREKKWYNEMELSWVGDFNPKMIALFEAVGGVRDRKHKTLRYMFDQSKNVERAKITID
ncbi:MAG: GNAT family N-acetyltransferase [Mangrovibacterium sp.]